MFMKKIKLFIIIFLVKLFSILKKSIICLVHAKLDWLRIINDISYTEFIIFYLVWFCIGRIFLIIESIRFSLLHQIFLTIISFLIIYSFKFAYKITEKIKTISIGLINTPSDINQNSMKDHVDQMVNLQGSIWWLIIMLYPPFNFAKKIFYLGFVERNLAGYYAVIFAASAYYIALLGYVQIGISLFTFYKISCNAGNCIPLDFPSDVLSPPEWLTLWKNLFDKIVKLFFIVGALFTLEYILLMPQNVVTIENGVFAFNVRDPNAFISSWGTIVIFIIIALPLIAESIKHMMKILLKNLNKKINREYELLFPRELTADSALNFWVYKQLTESPIEYKKYFYATHSIIPIISTIVSLILNIVKLYESILPQLLQRI